MEKLQIQKFGITKDGSKPYLYKMKNDAGMEVQVSDFGAMRMQPVMKMERQRSVQLSEEMQTGSVVRV